MKSMPDEPTYHSQSKTTVQYRSAPVWSIRAAFTSFVLFAGLYAFLAGAPVLNHIIERPAAISPPAFGRPVPLVEAEIENRTSVFDMGLSSLSALMNRQLGNEVRQDISWLSNHPIPQGGMRAFPKTLTPAISEIVGEADLDRARFYMYNNAAQASVIESIFLCLAGLSLILALRLKENKLQLDKDGLHFPSGMMAELNWRRRRSWVDLSAIALNGTGTPTDPHKMQFYFSSGGEASIVCNRLSNEEIEKLFLALDKHAEHAMRAPALLAYRHEILNTLKQNDPSFTQLWEDEMNSHFAATNFVALAPESKLQNGKIKVVMHISSGGLSAVYLAERNKQMVVIKESVVPAGSSQANREKARDMFQREANMLMKLSHPQIAKVLDHFQENDRDYLMLEYIPGITLREYVRRHGPQSEERASDWAKQIADILDYLHNQNPPVIHRDLTPDNLMITPSGKIVLIDFGAANQFLGTATGTIVGKQFYISPEQFRGKAEPASDIYSLGGTLHYLLTGIEPEALSVSHPKKLRESLSDDMNDLVASCTALNASERVRTAAEFSQLLKKEAVKLKTQLRNEGVSVSTKQEEKQLK